MRSKLLASAPRWSPRGARVGATAPRGRHRRGITQGGRHRWIRSCTSRQPWTGTKLSSRGSVLKSKHSGARPRPYRGGTHRCRIPLECRSRRGSTQTMPKTVHRCHTGPAWRWNWGQASRRPGRRRFCPGTEKWSRSSALHGRRTRQVPSMWGRGPARSSRWEELGLRSLRRGRPRTKMARGVTHMVPERVSTRATASGNEAATTPSM